MISVDTITERKVVILNELEKLQEQLTALEEQRILLVANANAMRGAIQQCDFFLEVSKSQEEENE
jgi:hypothetical protein